VTLAPEVIFSQDEVSRQLLLQVLVGATATERAPKPACPLATRGADRLQRQSSAFEGSLLDILMDDARVPLGSQMKQAAVAGPVVVARDA
jgi:hypothetical protein